MLFSSEFSAEGREEEVETRKLKFLSAAATRDSMIQTRRIGLGWLPGASIGVLSGFFIFNEPLREFHAVQEKKNTNESKTIDNNNNNNNNNNEKKSSSSSE